MEKSELKSFQARLFKLRSRLIKEVDDIEEAMREDIIAPGDVSAISTHPADEAAEGVDEQVILGQNQEQLLEEVEAALERIEAGTFGKCLECGKDIPRERLDALPYAATCVECARAAEE